MYKIMTAQHQWVKLTQTKVSVHPDFDEEDKVVVFEDPKDTQAAEEGAVYGCGICGVPLDGNADSLCEGPQDE